MEAFGSGEGHPPETHPHSQFSLESRGRGSMGGGENEYKEMMSPAKISYTMNCPGYPVC